MFGITNTDNDEVIDIFTLCLLLSKWHIYTCKKGGDTPSFLSFLKLAKDTLEIERLHYTLNGDLSVFEKRWQRLYKVLNTDND